MSRPTSGSLSGPDGQTSANAHQLAKLARKYLWKVYPTTNLRQQGYGPAVFDVDLGDGLVGTVSVDVKRVERRP